MLRKETTTRLALAVLSVLAVGVPTAYSGWVRGLFSLDERVAERRNVLMELLASQRAAHELRHEFGDIVQRTGVASALESEISIRERLNQLLIEHQMIEAVVTPSRAVEDPKSGLVRVPITVTARGTMRATVGLLKDVAELPGLVRVTNPAITPNAAVRSGGLSDSMSLRLPLELMVLPSTGSFACGEKHDSTRPDGPTVRHLNRDYSTIWNPNPFSEPQPEKVLVYIDRTDNKDRKETKVNVTDTLISCPHPQKLAERIVMTLARDDDFSDRVEEIMVSDVHSNKSRIVKVGEAFDGGRLVKVNSRQAYVEREGAYYSYALGGSSGELVTPTSGR